ncbi:MAG TPA: TetR/AcrR family transcriptional regulator [Nevskia sp.]|nr:TetR/AcrR family transcriptional regulator [Nevskia sp.]
MTGTGLFDTERGAMRKAPRQQRSSDTVQRIQDALLEIIASEGYAAATTNRIAQQAQVNIASLYQYFPNRHAIALSLFEHAAAELAQLVHRQVLDSMTEPLQTVLPRLFEQLLSFMERRQAALLNLVEEVPELRESAQAMSLENLVRDISRTFLEMHLGRRSAEEIESKLFFVQTAGMALVRRYVRDRPAGIGRERFVAELSALLVGYLTAPPPCAAAADSPGLRPPAPRKLRLNTMRPLKPHS